MNRREFLHRTGAFATAAGLAGCLGGATHDGGSPGSSSDRNATDGDSADRTTTDRGSSDDCETPEEATAMGCPNSRVTETTFSTEDGDCGTEHRANVSFDPERVRVEGTVRTPTPQWGLELAAVEYDEDADSLTLRVRATESETANPGVQCVAEVPYEASVGFESALPGEVVVVHETNDGTVEAVRKRRSNDG